MSVVAKRKKKRDFMGILEGQEDLIAHFHERSPNFGNRCGLTCGLLSNPVFGEGDVAADLMFIGEAPGAEEDAQGRPFVGRSGKLLDLGIHKTGLTRDQVYITNIVKCRPPNNRNPSDEEIDECLPMLLSQIEFIQPKLIVLLGKVAASVIIGAEVKITKERGLIDVLRFDHSTLIISTYHPSYVLRNRNTQIEKDFFQDLLDARNIVYGKDSNDRVHERSIG